MSQMAYGPSGLQTAVAKLLILHFSYRTDEPSVRVTRSLSNTHTHYSAWTHNTVADETCGVSVSSFRTTVMNSEFINLSSISFHGSTFFFLKWEHYKPQIH